MRAYALFISRRYIPATITIKFTNGTWSTRMVSASPAIRCRQIDEGDVAAVAELLRRGFPNRNRQFWQRALNALARREPPPGFAEIWLPPGNRRRAGRRHPDDLLGDARRRQRSRRAAICRAGMSNRRSGPTRRFWCRRRCATRRSPILNVSAAPHTWPIIEAQGFSRYSEGIFVCLPALQRAPGGEKVRSVGRGRVAGGRRRCRSNRTSCCNMPSTAASACGA